MKICLVQYHPYYPKVGMMDAYNEVVDSYHWGFAALGHQIEHRINHFDPDAVNIIFGFSIPMQLGLIESFPGNTIFVNLERYSHRSLADTTAAYVASKYQIWDYSASNLAAWSAIATRYPVYHARISYAPNLEKIRQDIEQDIDVLYYGKVMSSRFQLLAEITKTRDDLTGLSLATLSNIWGQQRDDLIARAKVVFNPSEGNIFEIVRVSYLLANKKAVVCTQAPGMEIEDDIRAVLRIVSTDELANACGALADDTKHRVEYANTCYDVFKQRDIREVIRGFFG